MGRVNPPHAVFFLNVYFCFRHPVHISCGFFFQYVRLAVDTEPERIKTLLQKKWNLPDPKLVISVIGGRKNLSLKSKDKRNFNEALKKVNDLLRVTYSACDTNWDNVTLSGTHDE